jgi:hypothetical protein
LQYLSTSDAPSTLKTAAWVAKLPQSAHLLRLSLWRLPTSGIGNSSTEIKVFSIHDLDLSIIDRTLRLAFWKSREKKKLMQTLVLTGDIYGNFIVKSLSSRRPNKSILKPEIMDQIKVKIPTMTVSYFFLLFSLRNSDLLA